MAQYSMNAYDADVFIPEFIGLMQDGDQMQSDLRYSPECFNVETPGGVLQPSAMIPKVLITQSDTVTYSDATMMYLRRTEYNSSFNVDIGGRTNVQKTPYAEADVYLVVKDGKLYRLPYILGDLKETHSYALTQVSFPAGSSITSFASNQFSWTTYEHDVLAPVQPDPSNPKYDVENCLIMSNEKDGVFMFGGGSLSKINNSTNGLPNFTCVARYSERIWGASKDTVYYSKPFSCTDWAENSANPENGGGMNRLATFDDDEIVAMKPLGESLIIFSKKRAWKVTGSDPSNYIWQEQYGNGCICPQSIAVLNNQIIMVGEEGLCSYDGYQVQPFLRSQTKELFREIKSPGANARAVVIGEKYIVAMTGEENRTFDTDESGANNKSYYIGYGSPMIVFDSKTGAVTLRASNGVLSFCEDTPYYFASEYVAEGTPPSLVRKNYLRKFNFDSWYMKESETGARWVSPWITFNRQDIKKGGFELYFTPEIEPVATRKHQYWQSADPIKGYPVIEHNDPPATYSVTLKISIQTEKKTKTKNYTINNLTEAEVLAGKQYRMKRLHFGGAGRRFRVIIEEYSRTNATWRLIGGVHIVAETDKD